MNKYLIVIKIKPEAREKYVAIHKQPWREMLLAIKEAGFVNESIWYFCDQSIIYLECEDYEACNKKLRDTDTCKKWDVEVCPWFSESPVMCEKIFDLNQQIDGKLLPF